MTESCKVCDILAELDTIEAEAVNSALLDREVTATLVARILSKHVRYVGETTVKTHRLRMHKVNVRTTR